MVSPEYQRQGCGRLLVKWGTKKADELGVDVSAQDPLQKKCVFADLTRPRSKVPQKAEDFMRRKDSMDHSMW